MELKCLDNICFLRVLEGIRGYNWTSHIALSYTIIYQDGV